MYSERPHSSIARNECVGPRAERPTETAVVIVDKFRHWTQAHRAHRTYEPVNGVATSLSPLPRLTPLSRYNNSSPTRWKSGPARGRKPIPGRHQRFRSVSFTRWRSLRGAMRSSCLWTDTVRTCRGRGHVGRPVLAVGCLSMRCANPWKATPEAGSHRRSSSRGKV